MAPITQASDESNHQALLDRLDVYAVRKPFRQATWKRPIRRNKNVKQIISEASRKEASVLATRNNSGVSTPIADSSHAAGEAAPSAPTRQANIAQANQSLSNFVKEKNALNGTSTGPAITYTNIESAPSLQASSKRHYCDITGLAARYTDPKTRLRYHNAEVFASIRALGQGISENYLGARGAHTVLK